MTPVTDPLGWKYFIGRTLIRFTPNHDGTIMRFYFDNGIKLTATSINEDEERDEPRCVLTRNPQQVPHALTAALKGWAKSKRGGFEINAIETHTQPSPWKADGDSCVYHMITLRGTTPYYATREGKARRKNSEYTIDIVAQSDMRIDGWPTWDWSMHDELFIKEKK